MGKAWIVLVCLAVGVPACTGENGPGPSPAARSTAPASDGWVTFTHPGQPWTWRHPKGWHIRTFDAPVGMSTHEGAILSNVRHRFAHPRLRNEETSAWDFRHVPAHAVVLELSQSVRLAHACETTVDTPLTLSRAEVVGGDCGSPPRRWLSLCVRGQASFGLHVWLGEDASSRDKAAARKVVRSIRFREPVGTITCENEEATDLSLEPNYSADYLERWHTPTAATCASMS